MWGNFLYYADKVGHVIALLVVHFSIKSLEEVVVQFPHISRKWMSGPSWSRMIELRRERTPLPSNSRTVVGYSPYKIPSCETISCNEGPIVCPRDTVKVPSISRLVLTAYWAMNSNGYRLGPYLLFILLNHKGKEIVLVVPECKIIRGFYLLFVGCH